MKPPATEWRAWLYAVAWLGGGLVLTGLSVWLVTIIRYDWPAGTELKRLDVLGVALYMMLSGPLLVMLGLGLRNAIRTLKGTAGGATLEVTGHDTEEGAQ